MTDVSALLPHAPEEPPPELQDEDWLNSLIVGEKPKKKPLLKLAPANDDEWIQGLQPKTFSDAWKETGAEQVPFVGMFVEGARTLDMFQAAKKAERGEDLTPEETKTLSDFFGEKDRDKSWGYQVGKILFDLPAYGLEFWAGGGVARGVGKAGLAVAGKAAREAVERASLRMAENVVSKAAAKAVETVAVSAGTTAAMAAAPGFGRVGAEGTRRALQGAFQVSEDEAGDAYLILQGSMPSFMQAVGEGAISMWVENLSEFTGGAINKLPLVDRATLLQMALVRKLVPPGQHRAALRKLAKGTSWNGLIGEWGEERVADALHSLVQGDPWSWPDLEQGTAELVAFAVPGAIATAPGAIRRATGGIQLQRPPSKDVTLVGPEEARGTVQRSPIEGPAEAPAIQPPQPSRPAPSTPEETVEDLRRANVLGGALAEEDALKIVPPPSPEAEEMVAESEARGHRLLFVESPKPLRARAAYGRGVVVQDVNLPAEQVGWPKLYHEWGHGVADIAGEEFDALEADLMETVPDLLNQFREGYAKLSEQYGIPRSPTQLDEEAVTNTIESVGGFLRFTFEDPQRAVRLAQGNPGFFKGAVDAFIRAINSVFGTKIPTHLQQELADLQKRVAASPIEGAIPPQLALRLALRIRETLNATLGRPLREEAPAAPVEAPAEKIPESSEQARAPPAREGGVTITETEITPTRGGLVGKPVAETTYLPAEKPLGPIVITPIFGGPRVTLPGTEERPKPSELPPATASTLPDRVATHLLKGGSLSNAQRKTIFLKSHGATDLTPKATDEAIEQGVTIAARRLVHEGRANRWEDTTIFDQLQSLYQRQPKLEERTSQSKAAQAYSTPAPLAFLASRLAGVTQEDLVYEPSAGHGMLLLDANPNKIKAVEKSAERASFLRNFLPGGALVATADALTTDQPTQPVDVILANPPFGSVIGEGGATQRFQAPKYVTTQIDHAIALRALHSLKADGRAVLILGGKKPFGGKGMADEERRADLYNTQEQRGFWKSLLDDYNVVDHFTVAGELYDRQGASWPIDFVVIQGRAKSALDLPGVKPPRVYTTWDDIRELVRLGAPASRGLQPGRAAPGPGGGIGEAAEGAGGQAAVAGEVAGRPGGETVAPAGEGPGGGPATAEGEGGGRQRDAGRKRPRPAGDAPAVQPGRPAGRGGAGEGRGGLAGGRAGERAGAEGAGAGRPGELGGRLPPGARAPVEEDPFALVDAAIEEAFGEGAKQAPLPEAVRPKNASDAADALDALFSVDVWHGTPHEFEKFETSAVGTGQGAASFGWGLYFAGAKEVAEHYRQQLSGAYAPRVFDPSGRELTDTEALAAYFKPGRIVLGYGGADRVVAFHPTGGMGGSWAVTVRRVRNKPGTTDQWEYEEGRPRTHATDPRITPSERAQFERVLATEGYTFKLGRLLQARLAPDPEDFLDWDKPLAEQSPQVRTKIVRFMEFWPAERRRLLRGEDFYRENAESIARVEGFTGGAREAYRDFSRKLLKAGVPGIRYLDQGSRSKAEEPTYNYVVFDEKDIEIRARFSIERPPGFDEDLYQNAKPMFEAIATEFGLDPKDMGATIQGIIKYLRDVKKLVREKVEKIKNYVAVYAKEAAAAVKAILVPTSEKPAEHPKRDLSISEGALQVPYEATSKAQKVGTLVPVNMQTAIRKALERVQGQVGDIDAYVAERLGFTVEQIVGTPEKPGMLSAEQIDGLALAIWNIERGKGFVIGDQTGVGKGRFVAGLQEYARRKGWSPVFITKENGLYSDMHRDLYALGLNDWKALITDRALRGKKKIPLPPRKGVNEEEGDRSLESVPPEHYLSVMSEVAQTGRLPAGYDALFSTYNQINLLDQKEAVRHKALKAVADNALYILDESHNAGGSPQTQFNKAKGKVIPTRADFVRDMIADAPGVVFSSATWAKSPHVMGLYYRTDLGLGLTRQMIPALVRAIERGGVPLQQILSAMLAESGQYVRREMNMEGISLEAITVEADLHTAGLVASTSRDIFKLDTLRDVGMTALRKAYIKSLRSSGASGAVDTAVGDGSAGAPFSSLMHNVVRQALFAIKVKPTIAWAKEAVARNEKPLIGVADTLGAMLDDYLAAFELKVGQAVPDFTFNRIFERYLERTRRVTVLDAFKNATHHVITDEEAVALGFGPTIVLYKALLANIRHADMGALSASPIDAIIQGLQKEGITVGEITGRDKWLDYSKGETPILRVRQNSGAAKKRTTKEFNNGTLQAVLLNQSGATGYSMHASREFKDQSVRHLAVVQPEANIDTFMQLAGRPNRTGQVVKPKMSMLLADLPAERRPAAVLLRKLASMNANVTSKRGGAMTLSGAVDYLNKYGNQIVATMLVENPDLSDELDVTQDLHNDEGLPDNFASKVSGRLNLLDVPAQEAFLDEVVRNYTALIESLDALGMNTLEAKVLDLDAHTVQAKPFTKEVDPDSPFGRRAVLEEVDVKRLERPLPWKDVAAKIAKAWEVETLREAQLKSEAFFEVAGGDLRRNVGPLSAEIARYYAQAKADAEEEVRSLQEEMHTATEDTERKNAEKAAVRAASRIVTMTERVDKLLNVTDLAAPGFEVRLTNEAGDRFFGVVVKVRRTGHGQSVLAASTYEVEILTSESAKPIKVTASQIIGGKVTMTEAQEGETGAAFTEGGGKLREKRWLVTGNVFAGYMALQNKGQFIFYTDDKGEIRPGLMMPRAFDPVAAAEDRPVTLTPAQVMKFLARAEGTATPLVQTIDGAFFIERKPWGGGWKLKAANKGGKPYYLLPKAIKLTGGFAQSRGDPFWIAELPDSDTATLRKLLDAYSAEVGAAFTAASEKKLAADVAGLPDIAFSLPVEPDNEMYRVIKGLHKKALRQGEATKLGQKPSATAVTSEDPAIRAYHRAVREVRAESQERIAIEEQIAEANRHMAADHAGVKAEILRKVDADEGLSAWETMAADILKEQATLQALSGKASGPAYAEAVRLNWAYQDARRETARALGVIRDPIRAKARTGRRMLADLVSIPSPDLREKAEKLREEAKEAGEERRKAIREELVALLEEEGERVGKVRGQLIKAGLDPKLITEEHFKDPITYGRIARAVHTAKNPAGPWDWFLEWRLAAMLSGPLTQVANITGNAAHMLYDQHIRRIAEAVANSLVKDKGSASWGEVAAFYRAFIPAAMQATRYLAGAYRTELPVFELDMEARGIEVEGPRTKWEHRGPAIPGPIGRIARAPSLTTLLAFDEFFKALTAASEVSALAYRQAKREGKHGEELTLRMRQILDDPSPEIQAQGLHRARRATFQNESPWLARWMLQLRHVLDHSVGKNFLLGMPLGSMILPFIRTPVAIFRAGLLAANPFYPMAVLYRFARGNYRGAPGKAVQDVAQGAINFGTAMLVLHLALSTGDDDDLPLITGSGSTEPGGRDLEGRTVPPYSIRFGNTWYSYRRVEPAAVTLATLVDLAREAARASEHGTQEAAAAAFGRFFSSIADQASDKTFLRTLGDIYKAITDRSEGLSVRLARDTLVLPMVPNIIRQPARNLDPEVRANLVRTYEDKGVWDAAAASLPYYALPMAANAPPARYDLWGRPMVKADATDNIVARLFSPMPTSSDLGRVHALDRLILRYNERVEKGEIGPDARAFLPKPPDYWYREGDKTRYWNDVEYATLAREAGEATLKLLDRRRLDFEKPDEADIEAIKEAISDARKKIRDRLKRSRSREPRQILETVSR